MAGGGRDGHAARVQYVGGAGREGIGRRPLFRPSVCVSGTPGRSFEDHLVGQPGSLPIQQTTGTRAVRVARSEGWQGQRDSCTIIDAARRDRLANAKEDMAAHEHRVIQ